MVKNKFAVMTLASLALVLNAGAVRAEEDAMFSMDDGFGADSTFDFDFEQSAQQNGGANAGAAAPVSASDSVAAATPATDSVPAAAPAKSADQEAFADSVSDDAFAAMSAALEGENASSATEAPASEKAAEAPAVQPEAPVNDMDVFSQMQTTAKTEPAVPASERMLGKVDSSVFREMAAIERETALLELKAKKEKLLAEIENSRANLRRNQLDELERREQITRNRINWEVEQEQAAERRAMEAEQVKREMERQERMEQERIAREKEMAEQAKRQAEEMRNNNVNVVPDEDISALYTIEEVRGVGGDLYAVLISDNGTINVREGYPLRSGYKVSKVTTSFVEVKKGDRVALLRFANKSNISN
jgi:hypothetical protein